MTTKAGDTGWCLGQTQLCLPVASNRAFEILSEGHLVDAGPAQMRGCRWREFSSVQPLAEAVVALSVTSEAKWAG